FAQNASLPATYWAFLAFICSCFFTFLFIASLKIMLPVNIKKDMDERLRVYKQEHISVKLMLLITLTFSIFFLILYLTSPVPVSFLVEWIPLWQALAGGLLTGFLTSLLLIISLKFYIKNNKNEKNTDQGISFRDA